MYKALYSISSAFVKKHIYVYGINRDSITMFTDLAFRDADIAGFWEDKNRFVGDFLLNRPIVSTNQLCDDYEAIVVLPKEIEKEIPAKYVRGEILFYVEEIIELNPNIRCGKDIYIYGIGRQGEKVYDLLTRNGIDIIGGCITDKEGFRLWHEKPVISVKELKGRDNYLIIIATTRKKFKREMLNNLVGERAVDIFIDQFMEPYIAYAGTFFQIVGKAVKEQKDIWLYGKNDDAEQFVERIFKRYQIEVKEKIYKREMPEYHIRNIYELMHKNIRNIVVVISEQDAKEVESVCDMLDSFGFSLEAWNYTAIELNTMFGERQVHTKPDYLLGYSTEGNEKYPGYIIYGKNQNTDIKILILGSSTATDGMYRVLSWVRVFYEKLVKAGYHVTIFNGATNGFTIVQEFLMLCRDGKYLRPDYVISFSGVNDTVRRKSKNQFCMDWQINTMGQGMTSGIESKETMYDFWCGVTKLMKTVAEAYGAKFLSFLQPMYSARKELSISEIGMFEVKDFAENVRIFRERSSIEQNNLYKNLLFLFDNEKDAYIDICHYSSEKNRQIADIVYNTFVEHEG